MSVTLLCTIFYVYIWTCLSEINLYSIYIYNLSILHESRSSRWYLPFDSITELSSLNSQPISSQAHLAPGYYLSSY